MIGANTSSEGQIRDKISGLSRSLDVINEPDLPKDDVRCFLAYALKELLLTAKQHHNCFRKEDVARILGVVGKRDGAKSVRADVDIIYAAFQVVKYVSKANERSGQGVTISPDKLAAMETLQASIDRLREAKITTAVSEQPEFSPKIVSNKAPTTKGSAERLLATVLK